MYDAEDFLDGLFRRADLPAVPDIRPDDLPPDWQYVWEERAAIMEYDGGLPKEHAETAALVETLERMHAVGGRLDAECHCPACRHGQRSF